MATLIRCPECSKSFEINQPRTALCCPFCDHEFILYQPDEPVVANPLGDPAPTQISQSDISPQPRVHSGNREAAIKALAAFNPHRPGNEMEGEVARNRVNQGHPKIKYSSRPLFYAIVSVLLCGFAPLGFVFGAMARGKAAKEIAKLPKNDHARAARNWLKFAKILGIIGMVLQCVILIIVASLAYSTVKWIDEENQRPRKQAVQEPAVPFELPVPMLTPPKLPGEAAYRPWLAYGDKFESRGMAFITTSPKGKLLALTAAHVLEPNDWNQLHSVLLATVASERVVTIPGKPAYVGRGFGELPPLEKRGRFTLYNTSEDFTIWFLPATAKVNPLELSDHEPAVDEWVWVVGPDGDQPLRFHLAKVIKVSGGTFLAQMHQRFPATGFSGSPILTTTGMVIGTTLASTTGGLVEGPTVANIRKRIVEY
jgi:hypothetical protein